MGVCLPYPLSNQICIFLIIVASPIVLYVSGLHVWTHVRNYRNPVIQRYCIRISLIVPVYLANALLSFAIPQKGLWVLELVKASYEAFALYSFMALMLAFVGGPASLVDLWESEDQYLTGDWLTGTCLHGTMKLDGLFLRRLVQGVIQFVIVRLLIVITVPILIACEVYIEGKARLDRGWIYIMLLHNVSLWICLYSLWLFFLSTRHYLRPFSPALKFGLIKSIIFISFWQKIVLEIAIASSVLEKPEGYTNREMIDSWNSFLLILECLPIAVLNFYAFGSRTGSYDTEWGSWRLLMEHGNLKKANSFPMSGRQYEEAEDGEEIRPPQAVKPLAAFQHAVNAGDVVQHACSTFSDHYGRKRYLALELSQREAASQQNTPLPSSERGGKKNFGTFT
ncbi:subunit alpha of organic solute transporter [Chloropicon primus]|uniref:Subunit alpha of organic solute transporter n=1 Tax=Chloropicon primus TaxID=1764295 RepID=A0A5B8MM98_9CHLO|nr:subunit alpha of organic solute transporter [Chloropicon primus]|mmetsp:Transcript_11895/g.32869  ORF Transcript_11895/g.32869 Transcript_11895/m.32869 type:complete len:395 (+) Transcript_11895:143-1327(+)|eukprot:QDZ21391.1 subunit alpha of organic solute transporter [Chloropicon primus]